MLSRSTVTTGFEVLGFLLLAAAAGLGFLLPWRDSTALAVAGAVLITESLIMSALGPKPGPPGEDAA